MIGNQHKNSKNYLTFKKFIIYDKSKNIMQKAMLYTILQVSVKYKYHVKLLKYS